MMQIEVYVAANKEQVGKPWIWQLCRDFQCRVTLKKANVEGDFGTYLLELDGSAEEIQRATAWLMTTGMHVEAMTRSLGV